LIGDGSRGAPTRKRGLEELETVGVVALFSELVEFGDLFADVVADVELAVNRHHLVILLVLQRLLTQRVVAHDSATLGFVLLDF